ncbi:5897_t:CDS:2 [Funneliformis mosseae]|uniref:5897_t:CDS:1 n=1 Tax=Funneliformis mosseae TaxID=27381 RepID=A0A9N8ZCE8_FUNMO|nr:5897_t:CDS:2 [Funneliformis mosseae]
MGGESISAEGIQGKKSSKKTSSKEISKIPLEETIRKVLHDSGRKDSISK